MSVPGWLTNLKPGQAALLALWLQGLAVDIHDMHGQAVDDQIALLGTSNHEAFWLTAGRCDGIYEVYDRVLELTSQVYAHGWAEAESEGDVVEVDR